MRIERRASESQRKKRVSTKQCAVAAATTISQNVAKGDPLNICDPTTCFSFTYLFTDFLFSLLASHSFVWDTYFRLLRYFKHIYTARTHIRSHIRLLVLSHAQTHISKM